MKIAGFHGYNINFSPFKPSVICVGGSNYGLKGILVKMDYSGVFMYFGQIFLGKT